MDESMVGARIGDKLATSGESASWGWGGCSTAVLRLASLSAAGGGRTGATCGTGVERHC